MKRFASLLCCILAVISALGGSSVYGQTITGVTIEGVSSELVLAGS